VGILNLQENVEILDDNVKAVFFIVFLAVLAALNLMGFWFNMLVTLSLFAVVFFKIKSLTDNMSTRIYK